MSVELLGLKIDSFNFKEAIERAMELVKTEKVSQVITINPEMFAQADTDAEFKKIVQNAELIVPDGIGVKIALKMKGYDIQRIPGIDFAKRMLERCASENIKVAIIGAKEDVLQKAVENLKSEINNLSIIYTKNGYFTDDEQIYKEINEVSPRLILVAMGSPRQEYFIYNAKSKLNPALMIGIGGSLDVWSGNVKRAPLFIQKLGLEWLYRTISQPERFKRIFPALPMFLIRVLKYKN